MKRPDVLIIMILIMSFGKINGDAIRGRFGCGIDIIKNSERYNFCLGVCNTNVHFICSDWNAD
jgi:hypothetical protein